jgi:hypothetical protein
MDRTTRAWSWPLDRQQEQRLPNTFNPDDTISFKQIDMRNEPNDALGCVLDLVFHATSPNLDWLLGLCYCSKAGDTPGVVGAMTCTLAVQDVARHAVAGLPETF